MPLCQCNVVKRLAPFVRHGRSMFRKLGFLALGHLAAHHIEHPATETVDTNAPARTTKVCGSTAVDMCDVNLLKVCAHYYVLLRSVCKPICDLSKRAV